MLLLDYGHLELHANRAGRITGTMVARLESQFALYRIAAGRGIGGRFQGGIDGEVSAIDAQLLVGRESKRHFLSCGILQISHGELLRRIQLEDRWNQVVGPGVMGVDVKLGTNPKIHFNAGTGARPKLHIANRGHGHRRLFVARSLRQAKRSKEQYDRRYGYRTLRHWAAFAACVAGAGECTTDARLVWAVPGL